MGAPELSRSAAELAAADNASSFEVRETATGRGLFAIRPIASGTLLFGEDDWVDGAERRAFSMLSAAQFENLPPALRITFLRYAYNTSPETITGTFHPEAVRHPVNFLNHSCEPNVGYDGADAIVALRRIVPGEELRMDYGTFTFSFDHDFSCSCGAWACRGKVTREDWRALVRAGLRLPAFMRKFADRELWG